MKAMQCAASAALLTGAWLFSVNGSQRVRADQTPAPQPAQQPAAPPLQRGPAGPPKAETVVEPDGHLVKSELQNLKIELAAKDPETPWGLALLPDGRPLVTEPPAR